MLRTRALLRLRSRPGPPPRTHGFKHPQQAGNPPPVPTSDAVCRSLLASELIGAGCLMLVWIFLTPTESSTAVPDEAALLPPTSGS